MDWESPEKGWIYLIVGFILRLFRKCRTVLSLPRWLLWINDKRKRKIMWTWTRSSSFNFLLFFRDWFKASSSFIFLADRLSGRTWYGLRDVWYHTFLAMAALSPSPVALLFMALSVTNYVFSGVDLFNSTTKQWALFLFYIFLHSYLLYFYCVKGYCEFVDLPSHKFLFRSVESLVYVCAGWPLLAQSCL